MRLLLAIMTPIAPAALALSNLSENKFTPRSMRTIFPLTWAALLNAVVASGGTARTTLPASGVLGLVFEYKARPFWPDRLPPVGCTQPGVPLQICAFEMNPI